MGNFNYFAFTIHMGSNCFINTGVRDLEVALFKANSTCRNCINRENLLNRPIYTEINTHILDIIIHSTKIFADSNEYKIALNDQSS